MREFDPGTTLKLAAACGALTGIRTTGAPFALSRGGWSGDAGRVATALASPAARGVLAGCFAVETLIDKLPWIPPRTDAAPLAGRMVVGGLCGAVIAQARGGSRLAAATAGAAAAAMGALVATRLRRGLTRAMVPDVLVGVAEDAVVLVGARSVARATAP